jgi:hypothetical protein
MVSAEVMSVSLKQWLQRGAAVSVAATGEVRGELPLDVVGEAAAVGGNEAPGFVVGAALLPARDSREDPPNDAALFYARRRSARSTQRHAVGVNAAVQFYSAHGLAFPCHR